MKKVVLYLVIFCLPLIGFSQTETTNKKTDDAWHFELTPYLWITSLNGDLTVADNEVPVDLNFADDILSNLKMAAMFHGEAKKNKLSIMLDIFYAKLGEDSEINGRVNETEIRVRLKQNMWEAGIGYTIAESGNFKLDALAGGRFFDVNTNTQKNGVEVSDKDFNFIEPYIGMRFQNDWNKWAVGGRFDVGGFGISDDEISYKYNLMVAYQFSELFSLDLGYQAFKPDYVDGLFTYNIAN
jgi:hypothetical protein